MKLYDVPRNTRIRVPAGDDGKPLDLLFDHIDGMFSVCRRDDGCVVHLPACTEVEVLAEGAE